MSIKRINNLSGFPENLPEEQIVEEQIKRLMRETYERYGYVPLETPAVENMALLIPDSDNSDVGKEIYAIERAAAEGESEKDSRRGLRYDLTVPLARYVAQHYGQISFPFKRYQIQKVWRGERPQKGRFREFYQADIDVVAEDKLPLHFDAEVIQVVHSILRNIDLGPFTMHINHRKYLQGLLEQNGVDSTNLEEALRIIDKLDKVSVEKTAKDLCESTSISLDQAKGLLKHLQKTVPIGELDDYLANTDGEEGSLLEQGKAELKTIAALLATTPDRVGKIDIKPSIARGLDYYTGCVYETTLDGLEQYGSICSGGRYENLANRFTKKKLPGVGISIGLSRLFAIIKEEGLLDFTRKSNVDVLVGLVSEEQRLRANDIARVLRDNDIPTDVYFDGERQLGKQIKYATKQGTPYMLFLNDDGSIEMKDLEKHVQETHKNIQSVIASLKD